MRDVGDGLAHPEIVGIAVSFEIGLQLRQERAKSRAFLTYFSLFQIETLILYGYP